MEAGGRPGVDVEVKRAACAPVERVDGHARAQRRQHALRELKAPLALAPVAVRAPRLAADVAFASTGSASTKWASSSSDARSHCAALVHGPRSRATRPGSAAARRRSRACPGSWGPG